MRPRMRLPSAASRSGAWRSSTPPGVGLAVAIAHCSLWGHRRGDRGGHRLGWRGGGLGLEVLEAADLLAGHPAGDRIQGECVDLRAGLGVGAQEAVEFEAHVLALEREVRVVRDGLLVAPEPRRERVADELDALLLDFAVRHRVRGWRVQYVRR